MLPASFHAVCAVSSHFVEKQTRKVCKMHFVEMEVSIELEVMQADRL